MGVLFWLSQGSPLRGQPWADGFNPVGIVVWLVVGGMVRGDWGKVVRLGCSSNPLLAPPYKGGGFQTFLCDKKREMRGPVGR